MITRIEIDGFKTFDRFALDLRPFTAVVGPNASGKSNLFDAIRFVSRLAQTDIREAMQELRGRPDELFRRTSAGRADRMAFAVEVLLEPRGVDPFGTSFDLRTQRLRYELEIAVRTGADRRLEGVYVQREECLPMRRKEDRASKTWRVGSVSYGGLTNPFMTTRSGSGKESGVIEIRQDGPGKRGRPLALSAKDASRTGLSTVTTAEFPHLYALRTLLSSVQFLQIDPQASRRATDRLAPRRLLPDASNLATVLARLMEETRTDKRPKGFLSDVVADLSSLIPSVADLDVRDDPGDSEYSFAPARHRPAPVDRRPERIDFVSGVRGQPAEGAARSGRPGGDWALTLPSKCEREGSRKTPIVGPLAMYASLHRPSWNGRYAASSRLTRGAIT